MQLPSNGKKLAHLIDFSSHILGPWHDCVTLAREWRMFHSMGG